MQIGNFKIGEDNKCFIIAELSANHNHDFNIAVKSIEAAKEAGADAVKLQTYTPDTITIDCNNRYFQTNKGGLWEGQNLYSLYKQAYTPWEWQPKLKEIANSLGMECFSSPFDFTAVDFLEKMDVPAYKVASFEITDIPLIEYMAEKGKPMIISTGIANLTDIEKAVDACHRKGNRDVVILKCTSAYPAKIEDANLKMIANLKETFGTEVGLSDHTLGVTVPISATILGAKVIEKHFILDKSIKTPDSEFSLDKDEFKFMVKSVREAEKSLGNIDYKLDERKIERRKYARSLFVVKNVKKGEMITSENVRSIRPSDGIHPENYNKILGKRFNNDYEKGTPLLWECIG